MNYTNLKLEKILNLRKWQDLQDSMSNLTKLAILTVNYKGQAITSHSGCSNFCSCIRNSPTLSKNCQKCDSRGGLEAVRLNKPYIYLCHLDIVEIAIPITVDDKYLGAILAGQIRLKVPESGNHLERVVSSENSFETLKNSTKLQEYYDQLPRLECSEIAAIAKTLFSLCNYIVEEALNKNLLLDMQEKLLHVDEMALSQEHLEGYSLQNLNQIKDNLSNFVVNAYISSPSNEEPYTKNKLLMPAFQYFYANKKESLSVTKAAKLCNVSPSYFSRLFTKEIGENYSKYLSKLKVEWSKQLLERTDLPISQISDDLGFSEPGYFIKTFKKFERVTPSVYRKYCQ